MVEGIDTTGVIHAIDQAKGIGMVRLTGPNDKPNELATFKVISAEAGLSVGVPVALKVIKSPGGVTADGVRRNG